MKQLSAMGVSRRHPFNFRNGRSRLRLLGDDGADMMGAPFNYFPGMTSYFSLLLTRYRPY